MRVVVVLLFVGYVVVGGLCFFRFSFFGFKNGGSDGILRVGFYFKK